METAEEVDPVPLEAFAVRFLELLIQPFYHLAQVWLGILPLYVSLLIDELYERKVSYGRAISNGFVMLWAGLNWAMHLGNLGMFAYFGEASKQRMAIAWTVTFAAIAMGVFTVVLGVRRKDRKLCEILGHARFSGYFLILLYPMQVGLVRWNWPSLASILIFALPVWLLIYLLGRLLRMWVK